MITIAKGVDLDLYVGVILGNDEPQNVRDLSAESDLEIIFAMKGLDDNVVLQATQTLTDGAVITLVSPSASNTTINTHLHVGRARTRVLDTGEYKGQFRITHNSRDFLIPNNEDGIPFHVITSIA